MKKMIFLGAVLFAFGIVLAAEKANVTGKWELTTSSPRGERTSQVEFTQNGEELKVDAVGREGQKIEGKGKVSGDKIEWTITRQTPRGEMSMTYKGTVSGETMKGDVQFGTMGSGTWTAKKAAQ